MALKACSNIPSHNSVPSVATRRVYVIFVYSSIHLIETKPDLTLLEGDFLR